MDMLQIEEFKTRYQNENFDVLLDEKKLLNKSIKIKQDLLKNSDTLIVPKKTIEDEINLLNQYINVINQLLKEKSLCYIDIDKYVGCLIGGAIGDALGYPIEFIRSYDSIKNIYGEKGITRFKLNNGKAIISDDTQMTLFTANGLIWGNTRFSSKGIAPSPINCIYSAYKDWYNTQINKSNDNKITWISNLKELNVCRAPGNTCMDVLSSNKFGTLQEPINDSKGCGGLMRVAPLGLYYSNDEIRTEKEFNTLLKLSGEAGAQAAALTHGHPLGIIPAYVFSVLINILSHSSKYSIEEALNISLKLYEENFAKNYDKNINNTFIKLMRKAINLAHQNIEDIDAIYELGQGWVAEEALAIAVYSCIKYSNNFEDAIICSVNHDGDSDSTGSITGNIMGASLGFKNIPEYYIQDLELKDEIIELAEDLSITVPPCSEYSEDNDEYWISKYIYANRDINLKRNKKTTVTNETVIPPQLTNEVSKIINLQNQIIENLEKDANKLLIKESDPFVIESCKNIYKALIVVSMFQNPPIYNINELLLDSNKAINLLKQFKLINKNEFDNRLSYIFIDDENIDVTKYLISLLRDSILGNNL